MVNSSPCNKRGRVSFQWGVLMIIRLIQVLKIAKLEMAIKDLFQKLLILKFFRNKRAMQGLRTISNKMIWILKKKLVHPKKNKMNVSYLVKMPEVAIVLTIKKLKALLI